MEVIPMSVLNDITKVVTETAKNAAKMSYDMVEVTRLNVAIGGETDKIHKLFYQIGEKVYEKYLEKSDIIDDEIAESCGTVKDLEKNIAEMRSKILSLKKAKECPKCKEILDIDMVFCYKCGEKQPVVEIIIEETEVPDCEEAAEDSDSDGGNGDA
jgi:hypothetical protein